MAPEVDFAVMVGLEPDERLFGDDLGQLPASVGQPESLPDSPARRRLVALGATLTGVSLIGGLALLVLGVVEALSGGSGAVTVAAFVLGALLVGTHWGWVHVAELSANNLESHRNAPLFHRRRGWLEEIEPYPRWEVSATTDENGSIAIVTVCYRPVVCSESTFTFVREEIGREVHSGDEPAATVAERAELLRHQAAADTAHERERYEAARDAYERAVLNDANEEERLAAVRAASEALSAQINSNLRDPPLVE
jgi:hypothetical protein